MAEEWRPIEDFPGYEASDLGNVRRRKKLGGYRLLRRFVHGGGNNVLCVGLMLDGRVQRRVVARLVWAAFRGSIPEGILVKSSDASNPSLDNLCLLSRSALMAGNRNALGHSRRPKEATAEMAEKIRQLEAEGLLRREIAERLGISRGTLRYISPRRSGGPRRRIEHVRKQIDPSIIDQLRRELNPRSTIAECDVAARRCGTSRSLAYDVARRRRRFAA